MSRRKSKARKGIGLLSLTLTLRTWKLRKVAITSSKIVEIKILSMEDDDVAWLNIVSDNIGSAFMSTSKLNDSILWHARLGHVHFKRMQDMSKDGLIPAFDMILISPYTKSEVLVNGTEDIGSSVVPEEVDLTKKFLSSRFSMEDMREADVILGIRIKHESNETTISYSHYIEKIEYSRVIGCLIYVMTFTRPDIAFVVGKLSSLIYTGYPSVLEGYTDASWISNTEDIMHVSC
ncbi:zinc finger, CCHC-type containing protein [Tanacetum coccineum]|uniref:Zinc finger, CCHC-type containing protein n=1 Tax=Tanacetum coccineum TaxID=301880 RepID=A0ABQ5BE11_9ASTR